MGELIGLAEFADAKRRRSAAEDRAASIREERAEAMLDELHRYRMPTQRRKRRRLAAARRTEAIGSSDRPPV